MSKSLEALENLVHCKSETKCKECKHKYRCTMERDYNTIKQDLELLKELKQRWDKEEWCKGIPLSAESLKSLFNYNEELFNKNLELDKENLEWKANNKEIEELYLNENKHWCETTDSLRKENQKLEKAIEKQINQFENLIYRAKKLKTNDIIVCLEEMQDRLKEVLE